LDYPEAFGILIAALCNYYPDAARTLAGIFERQAANPSQYATLTATRRTVAAELRRELATYDEPA
jgi:hypothetical protein